MNARTIWWRDETICQREKDVNRKKNCYECHIQHFFPEIKCKCEVTVRKWLGILLKRKNKTMIFGVFRFQVAVSIIHNLWATQMALSAIISFNRFVFSFLFRRIVLSFQYACHVNRSVSVIERKSAGCSDYFWKTIILFSIRWWFFGFGIRVRFLVIGDLRFVRDMDLILCPFSVETVKVAHCHFSFQRIVDKINVINKRQKKFANVQLLVFCISLRWFWAVYALQALICSLEKCATLSG